MTQPPRGEAPHEDIARDEYLLAALRHAPDADLEPSPSVSAYILAQAYAATKGRATPRAEARPWWASLRGLLAPRAPWAAAFGTFAAATLVGVMWSGLREPAEPAPATTQNTATEPQKATPAATAETGPALATPGREAQIELAQAAERRPTEPPAATTAADHVRAESGAAERRKTAVLATQGATVPAAANAVASPSPAAPPIAPPPPSPSVTPAAPPAAVAEAPRKPAADVAATNADAVATAAVSAPAAKELRAASAEQQLAAAGAAAPRDASVNRAAAGRADPSVRVDAVLRSATPDAAAWRHAGRTYAHGGEQRLWWSQVGDATQGRWQAVPDGRGDAAEPWIVLSINGSGVASFWFVGDALWLHDAVGLWRVPVTAAQRRAWQTAADRW